jgi:thioredoxin reductase (NADPH)
MEERVRKTENIEILMNHDTIEVLGDEQVVTGVRALNKKTDEVFDIEATGSSLITKNGQNNNFLHHGRY